MRKLPSDRPCDGRWFCRQAAFARRFVFAAHLIAAAFAAGAAQAAAPPNIVLILTDDQGWADSSVQMDRDLPNSRSTYYQTPRLEALANAGMRFSSGYSAQMACAQTRAALMSGRSPAQLQMTDLVWYQQGRAGFPLAGPIPAPFDPTQPTIPRMVKQADPNYQTALFGKWHLEYPATTTPLAAGFDFHAPGGNAVGDPQGVFRLAQLTNNFMQNSVAAGKPFFVQVAHDAVHELYTANGPIIPARPELVEKYKNLPNPGQRVPEYAALLEDLDTSVGSVLDKIDELGIADNTFVIYASDNGGSIRFTSNAPLRYGKATLYEGGLRVPFIAKGPGIEAGSFSDVPVTTTDLFSTIARLAGYSGDLPTGVESADFSPVLFNGGELPEGAPQLDRAFAQRGELYFHFPHFQPDGAYLALRPVSAVRDGRYKLYSEYSETGGPNRMFLYDLETDIGERNNLATQMPEKAAELQSMLDNYLAAVDASMPYDIKAPAHLSWNAGQLGADPRYWRSSTDVNDKPRETWQLGAGVAKPTLASASPYQPGLPAKAFGFDGGDVMYHNFFQVGDKVPRSTQYINIVPGTSDFNRSASLDLWFRTDSLNSNQLLFESGDGVGGISLSLGNADGVGQFNDLRFRVRGDGGAAYEITAPINSFANPVADFINVTAVLNDSETDRYLELYINGALAGRVNAPAGLENSVHWDAYDGAGLGRANGLVGANGGAGPLPFVGAFRGQIAAVDFWNHAISAADVAARYNDRLDPVDLGIASVAGDAAIPAMRPTDLRLGAAESSDLLVVEERRGTLASALTVNEAPDQAQPLLAAGDQFTSYLLHFDPQGSDPSQMYSIAGSVTFAEEIAAILYDGNLLSASDRALGSIGNYGVESTRGLRLDASDSIEIDADGRTLHFALSAFGDELRQLRVVTELAVPAADGDFNNDGVVDAADLARWKIAFGQSPEGDADGDGDTDGRDFLAWQRNLGAAPQLSAGAIPEPAAASLASIAVLTAIAAQRRRRS